MGMQTTMPCQVLTNADAERTRMFETQQLLAELCQDLKRYLGALPMTAARSLLLSINESPGGERHSWCNALTDLWADAAARLDEPLLGIKVAVYRPAFAELDSSPRRPVSDVSIRLARRHQTIFGTSTSGQLEQSLPSEVFGCDVAVRQIRELLAVRSLQGFRRASNDLTWCFLSTGRSASERDAIARVLKCESKNGYNTGFTWSSPALQLDADPKLSELRTTLNTLLRTRGCSDLNHAAHALGVSCRTLQRMLSASGATFSRVLGEVRLSYAKELLVMGDLNVTEVSHRLGFADSVAFRRAFRRWTGTTPSCYRTAQRLKQGRPLSEASL